MEAWTPQRLLAWLDELGVATRTVEHPPVYTVEQARQHRLDLRGGFSKNLFVRNKKGRMWLLVLEESREVSLRDLARRLGAGRFSFASPARLERWLGVEPGSVTPFGLVHDPQGEVTVAVDAGLLALGTLHFHPLVNAMTTAIEAPDLLRFLEASGHPPSLLDLGPCDPAARDPMG
jgi:Ala-tRNA(Pro) deacylase